MSEPNILRAENDWVSSAESMEYRGEPAPGCPVGCIYCNQYFFNYEDNVGRDFKTVEPGLDCGIALNTFKRAGNTLLAELPAESAVEALLANPAYTPEQTVIFENYTDPGLAWDKTISMMGLAIDAGHTGALLSITKLPPQRRKHLEGLQNIQNRGGKPIIMLSYAGLSRSIEPGAPASMRLSGLRHLYESGLPVIHSLRPLIKGYNTAPADLDRVLQETAPYSMAIVPNGFTVDDGVFSRFEENGLQLDEVYREPRSFPAHVFPGSEQTMHTVRKIVNSMNLQHQTQVYRDASCAVSGVMTDFYGQPTPDRMARWSGSGDTVNRWQRCAGFCSVSQIAVCESVSRQDPSKAVTLATEALADIGLSGFSVRQSNDGGEGVLVVEGGTLSRSELYSLASRCGWWVNNLPTEPQVREKALGLVEGVFSLDSSILRGFELDNDVWIIYADVDDEIGGELQARLRSELVAKLVLKKTTS